MKYLSVMLKKKLKNIRDEVIKLTENSVKEESKLRGLQIKLSEKYKVDLLKISYDDDTGRIYEIE